MDVNLDSRAFVPFVPGMLTVADTFSYPAIVVKSVGYEIQRQPYSAAVLPRRQ